VHAIKVGFVGSPENISTIAEIAADYADVPLIAYMPDLSWWNESQIDIYLDAFRELMLRSHGPDGQPQHPVALAAAGLDPRTPADGPRHRQGRR